MLKVTIEDLPCNDTGRRRVVGTMSIADRSADGVDDRDVTTLEAATPSSETPARLWSGVIRGGSPTASVWALVRAAIEAMDGAEPVNL